MSDEQITEMVLEKSKIYKPVKEYKGDRIDDFRKELENFKFAEDSLDENISLPDIPEVLNNKLAIESVENIDDRLREQASEVNKLVISDQELRELRGVFNPAGDAETKIDSLDKMANSYRLKTLRETD